MESLPVTEDMKLRSGDFRRHTENYKQSLRNLAKCGITKIVYNFMPVLDWIRTDLHYKLPDGSQCLRFDPVQFAAFDIFVLKRDGAAEERTPEQVEKAKAFYESLDAAQKKAFERSIIDVFPGCKMGLEIDDVRKMLARYDGITPQKLKENLAEFLNEVAPVAEEVGAILAIHPDDPPFPVLGLPRIASRVEDFEEMFAACPSKANTICFCTGSLSAGAHNDISKMVDRLADRIGVAHLRSTQVNPDGSFFEAGHLEGRVPMAEVVEKLLKIQDQAARKRRRKNNLPPRPRPRHGRRPPQTAARQPRVFVHRQNERPLRNPRSANRSLRGAKIGQKNANASFGEQRPEALLFSESPQYKVDERGKFWRLCNYLIGGNFFAPQGDFYK